MSDREKKCEERIDEVMESVIGDCLPEIDKWNATKCYEQISEYGHVEFPDPNPWDMDKDELIEFLKDNEIDDWQDSMDISELQNRLIDAIDDEEVDGLEDWIESAKQSHQEIGYEEPYGITKKTVYSICLAGGGPSIDVELEFDSDGECDGGWFIYKDWFDGARRSISADVASQLAARWGISADV